MDPTLEFVGTDPATGKNIYRKPKTNASLTGVTPTVTPTLPSWVPKSQNTLASSGGAPLNTIPSTPIDLMGKISQAGQGIGNWFMQKTGTGRFLGELGGMVNAARTGDITAQTQYAQKYGGPIYADIPQEGGYRLNYNPSGWKNVAPAIVGPVGGWVQQGIGELTGKDLRSPLQEATLPAAAEVASILIPGMAGAKAGALKATAKAAGTIAPYATGSLLNPFGIGGRVGGPVAAGAYAGLMRGLSEPADTTLSRLGRGATDMIASTLATMFFVGGFDALENLPRYLKSAGQYLGSRVMPSQIPSTNNWAQLADESERVLMDHTSGLTPQQVAQSGQNRIGEISAVIKDQMEQNPTQVPVSQVEDSLGQYYLQRVPGYEQALKSFSNTADDLNAPYIDMKSAANKVNQILEDNGIRDEVVNPYIQGPAYKQISTEINAKAYNLFKARQGIDDFLGDFFRRRNAGLPVDDKAAEVFYAARSFLRDTYETMSPGTKMLTGIESSLYNIIRGAKEVYDRTTGARGGTSITRFLGGLVMQPAAMGISRVAYGAGNILPKAAPVIQSAINLLAPQVGSQVGGALTGEIFGK